MALITLLESSKYYQNPLQRGIVELFPSNSAVLQYLPFKSIDGNAYSYNQEQTLPGIGFRAVNEAYDESHGVINPVTETLCIGGGLMKIDRAQIKMQGSNGTDILSSQIAMKSKAMSLRVTKEFIKGDTTADPEGFDGLQKRVSGDQLIAAGSTAGGDALTLDKLDELIDSLDFTPSVLFMNKTLRRKVNKLMRAAGQAQETVSGVFGKQVPAYAGIPIGLIGKDNAGAEILDFDEECPGGGDAVGSSVYAVHFGADGVCGLQNGKMEVEDQGYTEIWRKILVEWFCGLAVFHPRSVARLHGVKNA